MATAFATTAKSLLPLRVPGGAFLTSVRHGTTVVPLTASAADASSGHGGPALCGVVGLISAIAARSSRRHGASRNYNRREVAGRVSFASSSTDQGQSENKPRVVFVIGGPGSGKGTQCQRIAETFGFVHLSAGELLRQETSLEGSPLRAIIEQSMAEGGTVPSEVIANVLEQAMRRNGWGDASFVVDGYPRSAEQLRGWQATLKEKVNLLFCLSLEVDQDEMQRRLLNRGKTSNRTDDNLETIKNRFTTYQAETGPLLQHFEDNGKLERINGGQPVDDVWTEVQRSVEWKIALEEH